jgi:membrane-bound metal-dependent hydrolase YbcI (DUF457 family)
MPVVGHAFVGVATALTVPQRPKAAEPRRGPGGWLAVLVGLAYLPDIVGHGSRLLGFSDWRPASHSVPFALLATAALAPVLAWAFEIGHGRAAAIVFGSVMGHDILDFLQGSDRVLGWPLLDQRVHLRYNVIPENAVGEAFAFSVAFVVFLAARVWVGKTSALGGWRRGSWRGGVVAGLILLAAVASHVSKSLRDREVDTVEHLIRSHEYAEALRHLDHLRHWPTLRRSSEVDRLTARALLGKGDRAAAEARLLAAERAAPNDYRLVAELALFYASSDAPADERQRRVAPYQTRLEQEFAERRDVDRVLAQVEERLAGPPRP